MLTAILISFLVVGLGYGLNGMMLPVRTIRTQLQLIDEGAYPQAYDYLSSSARSSLTFDGFVTDILQNHVVMEVRDSSLRTHNVSRTTVTVTGILEGYGSEVSDVTYTLVKEDGRWKIDTFEWNPPHPVQ